MNDVEFLTAVRAVIEKGWCQRAFARNKDNWHVLAGSPEATSHCLVGAARAVNAINGPYRLHHLLWRKIYALAEWNDHPKRTKEDVLKLLDTTIQEINP